MIRIINAKFLTSASNLKECPEFGLSEVVFLGRSNVGKSSLINSLVGIKNLAKSSSTPGKTKLINFFEVVFANDDEKFSVIFVDLPGFGYAKVAKNEHEKWRKNLDDFLKNRTSIKSFIHLIDARHANLDIDENLRLYLSNFLRKDQNLLSLYTKCDKLNQSQKSKILSLDKNAFFVSSLSKFGVERAICEIYKSLFGLSDDSL